MKHSLTSASCLVCKPLFPVEFRIHQSIDAIIPNMKIVCSGTFFSTSTFTFKIFMNFFPIETDLRIFNSRMK